MVELVLPSTTSSSSGIVFACFVRNCVEILENLASISEEESRPRERVHSGQHEVGCMYTGKEDGNRPSAKSRVD